MSLLSRYRRYTNVIHRIPKRSFSSDPLLQSKCITAWQNSVKSYPNNIAIIQDDHKVTYNELDERSNALCYMLQHKYNLQRGDKIMHLSGSRIDDIQIILSCMKLGMLYMAINPLFSATQLQNITENSKPSLLMFEPQFESNIALINPQIHKLSLTEEFDPNNWLSTQYNNAQYTTNTDEIRDIHPFQVCFTSGTTGMPKGCVHSHNGLYHGADTAHCKYVGRTTPNEDSTLILTPLTGVPGMIQRLSVLFEGSTMVYPNKYQTKDAQHWHYLCEDKHQCIHRVLWFGRALSDIYHLNMKFNHLNVVMYTGDFTPFKTVAYLKKHLFPQSTQFIHGYGCTEAHWISLLDPMVLDQLIQDFDVDSQINIAAGKAMDDTVKIRIENDGEIVVKKEDGMMLEYLNNYELTKETIADGWLYTGDLGYIDEKDGNLYVLGRKKDIIKIGNARFVVPNDIEKVLISHVNVDEIAVVGYPNSLIDDTLSGEIPVAFIVLTNDAKEKGLDVDIIKKELFELCHQSMGDPDLQIQEIFVVDELPKTQARKLAKNQLRDRIKNAEFKLC